MFHVEQSAESEIEIAKIDDFAFSNYSTLSYRSRPSNWRRKLSDRDG